MTRGLFAGRICASVRSGSDEVSRDDDIQSDSRLARIRGLRARCSTWTCDVSHVAARFRPTTPVRIIGGYLAFIGVGLAFVWITMWASYVFAGRPTPVAPEAFKLVAALDISIMATVLGLGGILLWQRQAWGYVVAAIAGIQGSLYLLVLSVNSVIAIHRGLAETPGELPMWGSLAILTSAATLLLLVNARTDRSRFAPRRMCNRRPEYTGHR